MIKNKIPLISFENSFFQISFDNLTTEATLFPLKPILDDNSNKIEYFSQFISFIMEEIREKMNKQIQTINEKNYQPFQVNLIYQNIDNNIHKIIKIKGSTNKNNIPKLDHGFHNEAVLIEIKIKTTNDSKIIQLIAIAKVNNHNNNDNDDENDIDNDNDNNVDIDFRILLSDYNEYKKYLNGNYISVHWLCGLIPSERCYQICQNIPILSFDSQLLYNQLNEWPNIHNNNIHLNNEYPNNLNNVQSFIVESISQLKNGIYCIQGPPGTGENSYNVLFYLETY